MPTSLTSSTALREDASPAPIDGLYRDHRSWLFGWLRKKVGCTHRAEDLAQDVFLRVIQGSKAVRVEQARALLTTIARGLVVDHHRRAALEHAYLTYLESMPISYAPSPESQAEQLQALMALDRLLDALPAKVRMAFLLSQLDGLTYPQIAQQLDVSISSVQQYMMRAMAACYRCFYE